MMSMISDDISARLEAAGIIAVLIIDRVEDAVPLAQTLVDNGITAMELTLRTEAAPAALEAVSREVPGMLAGAGTILHAQQVTDVKDRGAAFGVSPGCSRAVLKAAETAVLPFAPGIATPSDIETALEYGCRVLKYFHAEGMGGVSYLKGINAPYSFLQLRYIPLGGLNRENVRQYLEMPEVLAVGGSWIAPRECVQQKDWSTIAANARDAVSILKEVR